MKYTYIFILISVALISCSQDENEPNLYSGYTELNEYQKGEEFTTGKFSAPYASNDAFGIALNGLDQIGDANFILGDRLFITTWVPAPASTTGLDGLGPTFNAKSCAGCHFKDGRGKPLEISTALEKSSGFLMRISLEGKDKHGGPLPVPAYGNQIQDNGTLKVPGEADVKVSYTEISGKYPDGTLYSLRKPNYTIFNEKFGSLQSVLTSPRVGTQTIGLGFVDALSEQEILKNEDVLDANKDGISGKANYVWNVRKQQTTIGKFGWKANAPTLEQQIAGAFHGDMGLTSSLFPKQNCPSPQKDCYDAPNGDGDTYEVTDVNLKRILFYQSTLAVPIRRNYKNKDVLEGKALFHKLKCISCHSIGFKVQHSDVVPIIDGTKIDPYSDFLLHDMGEALADHRPDFLATGTEWRTQPLWGIGLIKTVNKHTFLLHDGRARTIEEAILWHGGEAENSKQSFTELNKKQRDQVIQFINSL